MSTWQNRKVLVGTITDVSAIKKNEERLKIQDRQLQESLEEKEVLLKEIYHRTKNNMLIIISMLELQSNDIEDRRLKTIFLEMEHRIRSMALVHEKLYQSQNLAQLDGGSYLKDVAESLLSSMVLDGRITLQTHTEPVAVNIDYAIPLGLVANEIITNSIQHAFPGKKSGTISIYFEKRDTDTLVLTIADNGIGLPAEVDPENSSSFGMGIIINTLVKLQLKGCIAIERSNGTRYIISFPEPQTANRI
jgi:two-component sensor histidine kinase